MIALDAVTPLSQLPTKPLKMNDGGATKKLAEGPPENIDILPRFEGFEPGPNQFSLREEETVIPSEPNVQPLRTMDQRGSFFPVPEIKGPISSEPNISSLPSMDRVTEGTSMGERFMYGPVIRSQEVYPIDPDPGIMALPPQNMPQGMGGVPNLLQANMLKPAGILDIKKVYDI